MQLKITAKVTTAKVITATIVVTTVISVPVIVVFDISVTMVIERICQHGTTQQTTSDT